VAPDSGTRLSTFRRRTVEQQKQLMKQMMDFFHVSFSNAFNAGALLQDQFERVTYTFLEQATWMPNEGRQAIDTWVQTYKSGRDNFKELVDKSYKEAEALIAG
jgi:hypothetical protein